MAKTWVEITSEGEFTSLFTNAHIEKAEGYGGSNEMPQKNLPDADVYWKLSDGNWLAMHIPSGDRGGCETCGYGGDEKAYYKTVEVE
jgi:hypothetical protein